MMLTALAKRPVRVWRAGGLRKRWPCRMLFAASAQGGSSCGGVEDGADDKPPPAHDWGLLADGNRSNLISAGAGTSNLHTRQASVVAPSMPEARWRKLATSDPTSLRLGGAAAAAAGSTQPHQQDPDVLRKRLRWTATKRGWNEAGDFLTKWVESGGLDVIDTAALPALDRLLQCDDMFLMGIVLGNKETPPELDTPALAALQEFADKDW